jgi:hypothetical protein
MRSGVIVLSERGGERVSAFVMSEQTCWTGSMYLSWPIQRCCTVERPLLPLLQCIWNGVFSAPSSVRRRGRIHLHFTTLSGREKTCMTPVQGHQLEVSV